MDAEPNSSSASSNSNGSSNNSSSSNLLAQLPMLPMLQEQAVAAAVDGRVDAVDRNEAAGAAVAADQLLQPPLAAEVAGAGDNEIFISPLLFNNNATPPPSTSASSSSSSSSSSSHNLLQLYQQHHHHHRDHQEQQQDGQQQQQEPQSQSDLHHHHHHHHHAPEHVHVHEAESEHAHHHQHQHSHSPSPSSLHQQHQHHAPSSPYAPLQLQHHHHPDQLQQHRPEEVEDERQQQPEHEHDQHSLLDDNAIADTIDVEAAGIDEVEEDEGDDVLSAEPAPSTSREQQEQLATASSSAAAVVVAAESEPPFLLQEEEKQSPSQPPGYSTHFSYPYAQVHHNHYHAHHNHYAHFQQHEHQQLQPQHHHHHSSIGACSNIYGFDATSRGNGAAMFSHIVALNDTPQTSSGLSGGHSHSHSHGHGHGHGHGNGASGAGGSGSGSGSSGSRHHQHHHVDRLKMLYPNVNENETPLPRCWSPHDKCLSIGLSQNNLRVHYKGLNKQHNDAASVRTAYPIPASCGLYYFEVKIISKGKNGYMGIGLTAQQFRMNRLPGWDKQSYGYHGDDGNSFSSSGNGQSYGPKFSTGDIIGCCINFVNNTCFYTKNGVDLGIAFRDLPTKLYPTVGLQTPGEEVDANFGQEPFKFDQIEEMMKQMRTETKASIYDFPMPAAQGDPTTLLHDMVSSYLVHNGYSQTADAFGRATGQTFREDMLSIRNRQKILKLIMCGRMGQAIEMTLRSYPGLLENNQNLWFMLKCRQFVEMVNGSDVEYCPKFNTNSIVIYVPPKTASRNQTSVIRSTRRFQQNGKAPADDLNGSDSASASASGNGVTNATSNTPTAEDNGTTSTPLMTASTATTTPPNPAVIHADNQHEQETQEQRSQQELKPAAPLNCDAGDDAKNHESYNNASTNIDYTSDVDMENGGAVAGDTTAAHTTNGIGTGVPTSSLFRNSKFHNCNSSLDLDEEMDIDVSPSASRFSNGIERILEFGKELSLMGQHLEKENCMNDDDRQMLEDAFSLIAYSNPWSSPLGWQLCPSKRESVCTALNSAILESMNYPRRPPLDVCVAHASELLKIMAQASLGACAFVNIDDIFPQN